MKNYTTIPHPKDIIALESAEATARGAALADAQRPRIVYPMPSVTEVLTRYQFAPYDWRTFVSAAYEPLSFAMSVTDPADRTSRYIVMCDAKTGEWTVDCPSRRKEHGPVMIDAVKRRVQMAN